MTQMPISRFVLFFVIVAGVPIMSRADAQGMTAVDPVFLRAQQMVTAGQDVAGRAVIDSVLAVTTEGTPRYAEALFWHASLNKTAAGAERDYRRIAVEYPLSPRAEEALFRLSQLELSRSDRAAARAHLERIQREHPVGLTSARASAKLAQLAFEDRDDATGCAAVAAALAGLPVTDVELRNQMDYYGPRCANLAASAARDSANAVAGGTGASGGTPTSAADRSMSPESSPSTATTRANGTRASAEYSVQIAAYETKAAADALAKRLSNQGYAARVYGTAKPFRVRVGRYPTRERAGNAVRQMARQNVHGVIVEAEPR